MFIYQFFDYLRELKQDESGQGTTEYAIIAFKGKVSELWEAITSGINSL